MRSLIPSVRCVFLHGRPSPSPLRVVVMIFLSMYSFVAVRIAFDFEVQDCNLCLIGGYSTYFRKFALFRDIYTEAAVVRRHASQGTQQIRMLAMIRVVANVLISGMYAKPWIKSSSSHIPNRKHY